MLINTLIGGTILGDMLRCSCCHHVNSTSNGTCRRPAPPDRLATHTLPGPVHSRRVAPSTATDSGHTGHWAMALESKGRLTQDTGRWALRQNGCGAYNYDKNRIVASVCPKCMSSHCAVLIGNSFAKQLQHVNYTSGLRGSCNLRIYAVRCRGSLCFAGDYRQPKWNELQNLQHAEFIPVKCSSSGSFSGPIRDPPGCQAWHDVAFFYRDHRRSCHRTPGSIRSPVSIPLWLKEGTVHWTLDARSINRS